MKPEDLARQGAQQAGGMALANPGVIGPILGGCGCLLIIFLLGGSIAMGMYAMNNEGGGTSGDPSGSFGTSGGELANADALTEEQIAALLEKHPNGYNLKPYAKQIHDAAHLFNINPLFSLAIANKDSSLGTAGAGKTCRNPGNMEYRDHKFADSGTPAIGNCEDAYGGSARWAAFKTYGDGMQAKMWLLRANYLDKGLTTLPDIINKYCPPSECDVDQYVKDVENFMNKYGA